MKKALIGLIILVWLNTGNEVIKYYLKDKFCETKKKQAAVNLSKVP
jgi:hypothetical protein